MVIFTDKRNIFQDRRELSVEDQPAGKKCLSHFNAILDRLGIEPILADSP